MMSHHERKIYEQISAPSEFTLDGYTMKEIVQGFERERFIREARQEIETITNTQS